jgi:serine/threonine protein kinase/tetratricopeptide (TPR) repeat protein
MEEQKFSHYRVLKKLGEGGMGAVYLGEDTVLQRKVAIKFPKASGQEQGHSLFLREARLASALSHPHIATIFDFGETEDRRPYLVMEFVEGNNLHELLRTGPKSVEDALPIVIDVAEALEEAHRLGIVHRDIKPSNIVISERSNLKVLDFGLAKYAQGAARQQGDTPVTDDFTATSQGMTRGTPHYMSPEQIRGEEIDGRSDLFALGVILYEMLTGVAPFTGHGAFDIFGKILHVDPVRPQSVNARIPANVEGIILKALEKDRSRRYQSAGEMLRDLRSARDNLISQTRPLGSQGSTSASPEIPSGYETVLSIPSAGSAPAQPTSKLRSRPDMRLIAGGAAVAVVVLAALVVWFSGRGSGGGATRSPEAQHFFDQGVFALRDGAYLKARNVLERAIKSDSSWALAHARLAEAWTELDNFDAASREITAAHSRAANDKAIGELDHLYLQAITQTVDGNHAEALKAYDQIAARAPGEAHVHFDLGRALERNRQVNEAIEQHLKAIGINAGFAASHLRLGMLYGRSGDLERSEDHFRKAESIYETSANGEGKTEVIFQRGLVFLNEKRFASAREHFQLALDRSQGAVPNIYQAIRARLQLSSVAGSEYYLLTAERLANEAFSTAQSEGIEYLTMRSRISLGDVYFRQNKLTEAIKSTEEGRKLAERYRMPRHQMLAALNLGSMRIHQNLNDEGLALVRQANDYFKGLGFKAQTSTAELLIARATRNKGDYASALEMFKALDAKDEIATFRVETEEYREAMTSFEESLKKDQVQGDRVSEFYNQINYATALTSLGYRSRAAEAIGKAAKLAPADDLKPNLLRPETELALVERRFQFALDKGKAELERADKEDYPARFWAMINICRAATGLGGQNADWERCGDAITLASKVTNPRHLAIARHVRAQSLIANREPKEAFELALSAANEFTRLGLKESRWRSLQTSAAALEAAGEREKSREYARQASEALNELKEKWSREDFESYLSRPDVALIRRHLAMQLAQLQ